MSRYYDHAGVTIYHADARDILPSLPFTALVTDPPWPNATIDIPGADRPHELLTEMLLALPDSCQRLLIHLGCDSDPRILTAVPEHFPFFRACWLEYVPFTYAGRLLRGSEVAYLFGAPPASRPGHHLIPGRFIDTDPRHHSRNYAHECPRRLAHLMWLINHWTAPEDVVCDPFMGSGTTLVACKAQGRRAIGIDIRERDCVTAARRLAQESLFSPAEEESA